MRIVVVAVAIIALLAPSVASAKDAAPWATVNVCDTAKRPDTIGIRASMPGLPKGARLTMRFRVQYRTDDGDWRDIGGADSGWRRVGVARGTPAESGWSFTFAHPAGTVTLR